MGVIGECEFAKFAGLPVTPIYDETDGIVDFRWHDHRIEVKTFVFLEDEPRRRCSLLVENQTLADRPAEAYVLWEVNGSTRAAHPLGWAWVSDVKQAQLEVTSQRLRKLNRVIPKADLRPIDQLQDALMELTQYEMVDGVQVEIRWWVDRKSAMIRIGGRAKDFLVSAVRGDQTLWFVLSDTSGRMYATIREAINAAVNSRRQQGGLGIG